MKIFVGVEVSPMGDYITLDTMKGDIRNLDHVCETSECLEIRAPEILNYIHASELVEVFKNWTSKLRHGGKIIVGGTDLFECCKSVFLGHVNITTANELFYSQKNTSNKVNLGIYEPGEIVSILTSLGLSIDKKRVNGHHFVVEAHRD